MTKEEMAEAQELLWVVSDELADLNSRMRNDVNFTKQDIDRIEFLQPIAVQCRKKIGLVQPAPSPEETTDPSRSE